MPRDGFQDRRPPAPVFPEDLPGHPASNNLKRVPRAQLSVSYVRGLDLGDRPDPMALHLKLIVLSWHEVPAGSLPDNEEYIRRVMLGGLNRGRWKNIRAQVMQGWEVHDDGRLYHPETKEAVLAAANGYQGKIKAATAGGTARQNRDACVEKSAENQAKTAPRFGAENQPYQWDNSANKNEQKGTEGSTVNSREDTETPRQMDRGATAPNPPCGFAGKVIRVDQEKLNEWKQTFPDINVLAEIKSFDRYLATDASPDKRRNWEEVTFNRLKKKDREARQESKAATNAGRGPDLRPARERYPMGVGG